MGLFNRIKKAFTGNSEKKEDQKTNNKQSEQTEEKPEAALNDQETSATQSSETTKAENNSVTTNEHTSEDTETKSESQTTSASEEQAQNDNEQNPATDESAESKVQNEPLESSEETNHNVESGEKIESNADSLKDAQSNTEANEESAKTSEPQDQTGEENETPSNSEDDDQTAEAELTEDNDEVKEYDKGLKKSRNSFSARFNHFLANFRSVDEEFFDDLEELLIESDVGYETALRISDELREEVKLKNVKKRADVSDVIVEKLVDMYDEEGKEEDNSLHFSTDKTPTVFLFVGVNGAGKTTTIGKLAHRYQAQGKKVLLAAGDTFRAGAIEQLQEWGKRVNVPVEAKAAQTDPASVVYDAVQRAIKEDFDILLVDTAGRLQNKQNLMRELEKIKRVITRELPEAPQEVLLVLDGSTGQNALSQAKQFNDTTQVSGIVLTKLDGSSQGGIVLAIRNELHLPVKLVGLGEQMDDLRDFDAEKFIYGLFKDLIVGSGDTDGH